LFQYANGSIRLAIRSTGNFSYFNGGNFGFGTTTDAGFRLDVNGTARMGTLRFLNTSDTLEFANTLVRIRRVANAMYLDAFNGFTFFDSTSSVDRVRITQDGNVGIGTSSPSYPLHITRNSSSNYIQLSGNSNKGLFAEGSGLIAFDTSGNFNVYTGGVNLRATISSGGNVLINTTTDAGFRLDVNGTARVTSSLRVESSFTALSSATIGGTTLAANAILQVNGSGKYVNYNSSFSSGSFLTYQAFGTWEAIGADSPAGTILAFGGYRASQWTGITFHSNGSERMRIKSTGVINMSSVPTSSAGLSAGDIWNDAGTLKIV
jgi:hypothetical protein